jgi:hypothetical protein
MPKLFWTYAGRMAFSILCSLVGAVLVSKLGHLHLEPEQKLEKIVFDQSDLTRFDDIPGRVEAGHIAMRELKAAQEAAARRRAAQLAAEKDAAIDEARRTRLMAQAQHERKKAQATRRDTAPVVNIVAPAAPLVITPTTVADQSAPLRDGLEGVFDKLASGVSRIREFVVNAVRIEKPANLPFGGTSASSDSMGTIDDLRARLKLPAFDM